LSHTYTITYLVHLLEFKIAEYWSLFISGVFGVCRHWGFYKSSYWVEWKKIWWEFSSGRLLFREQVCPGGLRRL